MVKNKITYQRSGVDIDKASRFVKGIQGYIKSTYTGAVLKDQGAFGGLFALDLKNYKNPVLVSSTDGVGTKLLVAKAVNKHDTVGIDLVAMNVNDILCSGAEPLFFLDYIACGKLNIHVLRSVINGIIQGCHLAGCSLIGGETAEMPGMYKADDYDLAGFAVGVVEKEKIIDGAKIDAGDQVIGLLSNGLHSNGFSLVRRVFSIKEQKRMAKELLKPTRIYVKEVLQLIKRFPIKGIAHITGGAFVEKLTKILPKGKCFLIDQKSWPVPKIFQKVQKKGKIDNLEMFRTFNMGIGMVLVVNPEDVNTIRSFLFKLNLPSFCIGKVIKDKRKKIEFNPALNSNE